jgi:hypothetical protein
MSFNIKTYDVRFEVNFILLFHSAPFGDADYTESNGRMIIQ